MAEKKSFILYNDYWDVFEVLNTEELGELFGAIYKFVLNNEEPSDISVKALMAFKMVRSGLKRDVEKYEKICERNRENGRKGGRPRLNKDESVNL